MAEYCNEQRLHMGYSFELLTDDFSAAYIRGTVERLEAAMTEGWPCWAISNHDVRRAVTRWGGPDANGVFAGQLVALVCSLRGSVCLYQGEELGLPEADVPFEALQDPYGKTFWPNFKGRDGCRTPMPWDDSAQAGFSDGKPWLPIPPEHVERNVALQDADPGSVLNAARAFLRWRRTQPALRQGSIRFIDTSEPVLAFIRECDAQTLLVAFNLSGAAVDWTLPADLQTAQAAAAPGVANGRIEGGALQLPAHGAFYATI
jgi:alpha-glucosidase